MGRQSLRIIIVLGVLVTLVGGTGIFAAFTDRATTGQNSVQSGPRPAAADLQIALASLIGGVPDCDPENDGVIGSDDLTTGILTASGFQPGSSTEPAAVCLVNAGSGDLSITTSVIDLVDIDTLCTGDEAAAGDATCGGGQLGELSSAVAVQIDALDCSAGVADPLQSNSLASWIANPVALEGLVLAPGAVACVQFTAFFPLTTAELTVQLAQSDLVEWRFAFDASAS